ncbi:MAG: protein kinase, partial [Planctomycetaceae bacterium]|nr:protein kinase [Planctomycetaceae bacterium]
HRDIKPENILCNKAGEIRVIDFSLSSKAKGGLAMLVSGKEKTIKGTRTYIAPETILKKSPTIQSDIYSLGVTLFEIAAGQPPFAGLNPNDLLKKHLTEEPVPVTLMNPNATSELSNVILRLLAKNPKDRPADMKEVMSLFRAVKFFTEDPVELRDRRLREAKEQESMSVDKRLDSRADHDRTVRGVEAPKAPEKKKRLTNPIGDIGPVHGKATAKAAEPTPQPQMQPQMQPGMMPGMAPMMSPQMMPGMPQMMPGMMMPGMPQMMPGYPGGMPMPGYPQMPGQMPMPGYPQMPGQMPVPGYPAGMPGQAPPAGSPQAPQTNVAPAPAQQPPAQQPAPQTPPPAADATPQPRLPLDRPMPPVVQDDTGAESMEYMTELPDVS